MKYKTLIQSQNDLSRPPHRGAWIEMCSIRSPALKQQVAPRTGGRGLKCCVLLLDTGMRRSPPAQGGVD